MRLLEHRLQLQRLSRAPTCCPTPTTTSRCAGSRGPPIRPSADLDAARCCATTCANSANASATPRALLPAAAGEIGDPLRRRRVDAVRFTGPSAASPPAMPKPDRALRHPRIGLDGGPAQADQLLILPSLLEGSAALRPRRRAAELPPPLRGTGRRRVDFLRLLRDDGVVAQRLMHVLGIGLHRRVVDARPRSSIYSGREPTGPKLGDLREPRGRRQGRSRRRSAAPISSPPPWPGAHRRAELARIASADVPGMLDVPQVLRTAVVGVGGGPQRRTWPSVASRCRRWGAAGAGSLSSVWSRPGGGNFRLRVRHRRDFVCPVRASTRRRRSVGDHRRRERADQYARHPSADPPLRSTSTRDQRDATVRCARSRLHRAYYDQWAQP